MAYCAQTDILEQLDEGVLIQLTDDDDAGAIDDGKVDRAIARADAEIDAHCQARYEIPLSPVPDIIRDKSVDMAIYHLYCRRGTPPEEVVNRHKEAVKFLEKVMVGNITLGATEPSVLSTNQPVRVSTSKDDRTFTMDTMEGF